MCIAEWADGKYTYTMPYVNQNQCNDFRVSNNVITYNGTQVNPSSGSVTWSTFPFATSGLDFHMGRLATIENQHAYGWWYYLTLEDRNGSKLLDYVPVKNAAETAGFFDRVSGSFVTPTGGGALVAGEVAGEAGLVGVSLSDTMTADDQLPITATWKGGASGNLNEAANWACTNALGAELSGVVPRAGVTVVTFCGSLAFDVATAADRIWGSAKILGGSLAGNCDWSAMGEFALDGAFDLAGHSLVLTALPPAGEITSSTTGDPGVLQVTVAEGETIDNVDCALGGNLRFVKDGPGLFVATKTPQTYTGGNDVLAGTLKCGKSNESIDHGGQSCFGDHPSIDVRSGAKLDSAGSYYWGWHKVHLYGGTVMCSVAPSLNFFNPEFYLHEDSFFDAVASCDLQTGIGDLYGHTLTVNVGRDSTFLANWLFNNGTVVITGEGCCKVERSGGVQDCSTATLDISTTKFMQNLTGGLNVSNFIARCTEVTGNLGTPVRVKGRFTPMTLAFPTVQLQDGATLDLSEKTETWSAVSTVAGCSLSFAPNATVTVDTGTGPLTRLRLVSWDAANPPAGVDTLKAISTDRGRKLLVRENGIYVRSGLVILYK